MPVGLLQCLRRCRANVVDAEKVCGDRRDSLEPVRIVVAIHRFTTVARVQFDTCRLRCPSHCSPPSCCCCCCCCGFSILLTETSASLALFPTNRPKDPFTSPQPNWSQPLSLTSSERAHVRHVVRLFLRGTANSKKINCVVGLYRRRKPR